MSKLIKSFVISLSILLITSCDDGDGIKDQNPKSRMLREASCVVMSEYFLLYDAAELHHKHGMEAGRDHFNRTGEPNNFEYMVTLAREFHASSNVTKMFRAAFLKSECNTEITESQFKLVN